MARIPRKSDGRRIFSAEFKSEHIGRVLRGELTLADLSRELGIARSQLQRWKRITPHGPFLEASDGFAASVTRLRAEQHIRELQLLVGTQTVQLETLRGELKTLKKGRRARKLPGRNGRSGGSR